MLKYVAEGHNYQTDTKEFLERVKATHDLNQLQSWAQAVLSAHTNEEKYVNLPRAEIPSFISDLDPPGEPIVTIFPNSFVSVDFGGGFGYWGLILGQGQNFSTNNMTLYLVEWAPCTYAFATTQ